MTITYTLSESDILTLLKFQSSISPLTIKRRRINRYGVPIIYLVMGLYPLLRHLYRAVVIIVLIALAWVLIYPVYEQWYMMRYFKNYVKDNFSGGKVTMEVTADHIMTTTAENSMSQMTWHNITGIYELPAHIAIKLKNALFYVIPKQGTTDIAIFITTLKKYASDAGVKYNMHEEWKW